MLTRYVTSPAAYDAVTGCLSQKPIGTGPSSPRGQDNRSRDGPEPKLLGQRSAGIDRIIWRPVPDDFSRVAGFVTGEYDWQQTYPSLPSTK